MAIRTDEEAVKKIVKVKDGFDLDPMIAMANQLVDEICAVIKNTDGTNFYSTDRLTMIETLLAAHFYSVYAPRSAFEGVGSVQVNYEGKSDMGLRFTRYGQQAMVMDTAGGLARLENSLQQIVAPLPLGKPLKTVKALLTPDELDIRPGYY